MDSYQRNSCWLLRSTRGLLYFCACIRTESFCFCFYVPMHCIHASQNIQPRLTPPLFSCYSNLNCLNDNETDKPWPRASSCPMVQYCESCTLFIIFTIHRIYIYLLNCQRHACLLRQVQNVCVRVCACVRVCVRVCARAPPVRLLYHVMHLFVMFSL